uniref:Uncharacterized protein n=1 Tax=Anguilla anguilla TaxID=7936 RepID=A0A0E9W4K7_ANGAN
MSKTTPGMQCYTIPFISVNPMEKLISLFELDLDSGGTVSTPKLCRKGRKKRLITYLGEQGCFCMTNSVEKQRN